MFNPPKFRNNSVKFLFLSLLCFVTLPMNFARGVSAPNSLSQPPEISSLINEKDSAFSSPDSPSETPSVDQLSDIKPTDWAFSALKSLVERYGCITGYPDHFFRGNWSLNRYEFAAGLNACLDKILEIVQNQTQNLSHQEDLLVIQKLQEEFATELVTIHGRLDSLETRINEQEVNQFSPTTKLYGLTFFNITGLEIGKNVKAEGLTPFIAARDSQGNPIQRRVNSDTEITVSELVWLTLITSFTGKDSLFMVLAAGNGEPGINEYVSAGQTFQSAIPFSVQTAGFTQNQFVIRDFHYSFPIGESLRLTVGPRVNWFAYFDENIFAPYYLAGVNSFNSINSPLVGNPSRGSGAVIEWYLHQNWEFHAGYLVENNEFLPGVRPAADPRKGLGGRPNIISTELIYKPTPKANLRFLYNRSNFAHNGEGQIDVSASILGVLDDGPLGFPNGGLGSATADLFAFNFDWLVTSNFGLFGRYAYSSTHLKVREGRDKNVSVQAFQAGLAFPDLGKKGALGTFSFVIPMDILQGRQFFVSGSGDGATQYEFEINYFLPITDHIALSPSLYFIKNLNNFSDNPNVFLGNLRLQFSF